MPTNGRQWLKSIVHPNLEVIQVADIFNFTEDECNCIPLYVIIIFYRICNQTVRTYTRAVRMRSYQNYMYDRRLLNTGILPYLFLWAGYVKKGPYNL